MPELSELFRVNHSGIYSHINGSMLWGHSAEQCSALWIGFRAVSYLQDKKEGGDRETWSSFSSIKAKMNLTN